MQTVTKITVALGVSIGAIVLVQNAAVTEFQFLFWSLTMSRALLFSMFLAIGVVLGWVLHALRARRPADR